MQLQALFWLFLCLSLGLFMANVHGQCIDTFEPGCQQQVEVGFPQRNCIDPTKYYLCRNLNEKPLLKSCPPNMGFEQNFNTCLPWIIWRWEPCVEPPSRPPNWESCYN